MQRSMGRPVSMWSASSNVIRSDPTYSAHKTSESSASRYNTRSRQLVAAFFDSEQRTDHSTSPWTSAVSNAHAESARYNKPLEYLEETLYQQRQQRCWYRSL